MCCDDTLQNSPHWVHGSMIFVPISQKTKGAERGFQTDGRMVW